MTAEDINKMEEVKLIRLPSKREILDDIRYLLSASTLIFCLLLLYGLVTQKIISSFGIYSTLIIILLSGLTSASKSYEDIANRSIELKQAYKAESDHQRTFVILIKYVILNLFWIIGLVSGFLFLLIVLVVFLNIFPSS